MTTTDPVAARNITTGRPQWVTIGLVGILNIAIIILAICMTFEEFPGPQTIAGIAAALTAMPIITFLALFKDSGDIRTAIAGSFVILYFAFMAAGLNSLISERLDVGFGRTMFDSVNTLVGVIVGFYITGKTVERATESIAASRSSHSTTVVPD